jgi:glycosyltransferase involved in cell wall biosynthesis
MNILITTGLSSKDVGGQGHYGPSFTEEFLALGHVVRVREYGKAEKTLPVFLRHLYFLVRILPSAYWADSILALDTYSTGVPSIFAGLICRTPFTVRVGGDFLWATHVNRTGSRIRLSRFYVSTSVLSVKERIIFIFTHFLVRHASHVVFNTDWQRHIWIKAYEITAEKTAVVRNFLPNLHVNNMPKGEFKIKNFVWAGGKIHLKNLEMLKRVAEHVRSNHSEFRLDLFSGEGHAKVLEHLENSYAAILPSISDVCPNFIIEAASCRKPFIVTEDTGIKELFPKGGLYINPDDERALISSIEALLGEETYNRSAYQIALEYKPRDWQTVAAEFINFL